MNVCNHTHARARARTFTHTHTHTHTMRTDLAGRGVDGDERRVVPQPVAVARAEEHEARRVVHRGRRVDPPVLRVATEHHAAPTRRPRGADATRGATASPTRPAWTVPESVVRSGQGRCPRAL
jgi:hypothetical protein